MTERLHENEARVEELTKNWTSKWRETQKIIEVKKKEQSKQNFTILKFPCSKTYSCSCEIPVMSLIVDGYGGYRMLNLLGS